MSASLSTAPAPLLVGFSGGGDSLALLTRVLARADRPVRALIVDHALQPGSAAVAAAAANTARDLGAEAEVLTLAMGPGPHPHAVLRHARYQALCTAAQRLGGREIHLGHTADDQAETVWLRLLAAQSWRGLAGMAVRAPAPVWPQGAGITLYRPVLGCTRAELRAELQNRRLRWHEDLANADPRYARSRARQALASNGHGPALLALARRLRPRIEAVDAEVQTLLPLLQVAEGRLSAPRDRLQALSPSARRRMLALMIAAAGAGRSPSFDQTQAVVLTVLAGERAARTVAGARVWSTSGAVLAERDPGAVTGRAGVAPVPPLSLPQHTPAVWDQRLEITALLPGLQLAVAAKSPRLTPSVLQAGEANLPLATAQQQGLVTARWLVRDRIVHLAGAGGTGT